MSELLETISSKLGCEFLSDLKWVQDTPSLQNIIEDLVADEYSLQDWRDAIDYLVGENVSPTCPAEAKRYLLMKLLP